MWKAILSFLLFVGLSGFSLADTIPATVSNSSIIQNAWDIPNCTGKPLSCLDTYISSVANSTGKPVKLLFDGNNWSIAHFFVNGTYQVDTSGTFTPQYTCPSGYSLSGSMCTGNSIDSNAYCSSIAAENNKGTTSTYTTPMLQQAVNLDIPNPCDNLNGYPNHRANLPPGVGCQTEGTWSMTKNGGVSYSYSGAACVFDKSLYNNASPNQVIENNADNQACPPGTTSGQINGKNACVANAPSPSSNNPAVTTDGKDSNGNCAAGYTGSIDSSGNFICTATPATDTTKTPPTCSTANCTNNSNSSCPSGYSKVTVGGANYCTQFNITNNTNNSSSGGSSGSGTPNASGTTTNGSGSGSGSGAGDGCAYTGLFAFMCTDGPPSPNLDSSGLQTGAGGDLASMFDSSDQVFGNSSCPPDIQIPISTQYYSFTISVPYIFLCSLATYIKPLLLVVSLVGAAFIIFKRGG